MVRGWGVDVGSLNDGYVLSLLLFLGIGSSSSLWG